VVPLKLPARRREPLKPDNGGIRFFLRAVKPAGLLPFRKNRSKATRTSALAALTAYGGSLESAKRSYSLSKRFCYAII